MGKMTSLPKKILKGVNVEGVIFCSPLGELNEKDPIKKQEEAHLKSLEKFWLSKGKKEGEEAGYKKGWEEGNKEGLEKGLKEGKQVAFEEGLALGYESGSIDGRKELKEEFKESFSSLLEISKEINTNKEQLLDSAKPEIISFSLDVCKRILEKELSNPQQMTELIEKLLYQAKPFLLDKKVKISIPEEQYQNLKDSLKTTALAFEEIKECQVFSDSSLKTGNCIVESSFGLINFDLERALKEIKTRSLEVKYDLEDDLNIQQNTDTTEDNPTHNSPSSNTPPRDEDVTNAEDSTSNTPFIKTSSDLDLELKSNSKEENIPS